METSGNNTSAAEEAPASYYRSSIDRSLYTRCACPSESLFGGIFSTVKNPPCRGGGTVRCFFLDGKCRRHKCLFDLMTRCYTRDMDRHVYTHTREHLLPSLRSFRVSVGRATRPHVALLSSLKERNELPRKSHARGREKSANFYSTREIVRRQRVSIIYRVRSVFINGTVLLKVTR